MRPDQRQRLQAIADRLIEQTIMDADPDNWSGAGQTLRAMDKDTRGDALWCRKIAVQTVMLSAKIELLSVDPGAALGKNKRKVHVPVGMMMPAAAVMGMIPFIEAPVTTDQLKMLKIENVTKDNATPRLLDRDPIPFGGNISYIAGK